MVCLLLSMSAGDATSNGQTAKKQAASIPAVRESRTLTTLPNPGSRRFTTAAFSPDGKRIAGLGTDGAVCLWDVESGKKLLTLPVQRRKPFDLQFSPDGRRLATAGSDGIKIWNVPKQFQVATPRSTKRKPVIAPKPQR